MIERVVCGLILQAGEEARKRDPLAFSPLLRSLGTLRAYVAVLRIGVLRPQDEDRLRFGTFSVRRVLPRS